MTTSSAERQELDRAVGLLGRSTRHGRLLAYLGEKYFDRQEAQLTEFNLATEFFERPADRFDAGQDAVVRVEVHRLRRKLRDIYEKGAGPDGMRISLPAGSYVPQFSRTPEPLPRGEPAQVADDSARSSPAVPQTIESAPSPARNGKKLAYLAAAVALIAIAGLGAWLLRPSADTSSPAAETATTPPSSAGESVSVSEVHLMAGYGGSDVIDSSGERWTHGRFFSGGRVLPNTGRVVMRSSRPFLYSNWRMGEF